MIVSCCVIDEVLGVWALAAHMTTEGTHSVLMRGWI